MSKKTIFWILCVFNAALMVYLTFLSLELDLKLFESQALIRTISNIKRVLPESKAVEKYPILKKILPSNQDKPKEDELLFINISYDLKLIDKLDEDGFPIGNDFITDREKLARLFHILNSQDSSYKYIICDVFFKDPSPDDELLAAELENMKNIRISYHLKRDGTPDLPIFNAPKGLADYPVMQQTFLKFHLITNDTFRSTPLLMYEDLYKKILVKKGAFYYIDNKMCLNSIIIDHRIRNENILEGKAVTKYPFVYLGEFLSLPEDEILKTTKNKIILIGDFLERDLHNTVVGKMGGTLVLLNVYLSLVYGDNIINVWFFVILFIGYFFISMKIFSKNKLTDLKIFSKLSKYKFLVFLLDILGYIVYLMLLVLVIYFTYNVYISLVLVLIYIKLMEWMAKKLDTFIDKYLEKKKIKEVNYLGENI
ncbi:MAG TPA: CHASE2 domain-containing protein [Ignavibacteriales bacterium]|nr:CHASE2 domain-containing protein [Ignavibacteriales bacterium]HOL81381.1 CHASE2 domain-containing protein [Ignavibacteriales bacterium]HOM65496.1 CHASE2 domain-containing protein [Ignavibacteriales bacterium]HPD67741.1 CHASE2 domain-containing protein [Ignavibacteriales bacterium]HPP33850.1 CHASE2 domain-containing protein [Ignavibacteriales bacterium]